MTSRYLFFALSLLGAASALAQDAERPGLGVALGGGGARGIAHIGFLEWLEEHRIPVDYVAGTSVGGLVGGAYASGMSAEELRRLMREMDWDLVFLSDSPFRYKNFRRKEDARLYPSQIELGLKQGLQLPAGMNAGQQIQLVLDRIAAPYGRLESFDTLPLPFRCVAVDLRSREQVVLGSGSLALAMRATMAIPGVFTPVAIDDRLFIDGGALNNVPADVAKSMGAEVVIAVNVGAGAEDPPVPKNMFDVLGQTVDVMMNAGVERTRESADVVVTPDLSGFTSLDWRRNDALADRGYDAAEAARSDLIRYAVDEATYGEWREKRTRRRRVASPVITRVQMEGVPEEVADRLLPPIESALVGERYRPEAVREQVLRLTGTDRFSVVRYRLEEAPSGATLAIHTVVKPYGPPFLEPAVELQNVDSNSFAMNLRARLVFLDTFVPDSEVRVDAAVGTKLQLAGEIYRPLGGSPLFVAPRAYWSRRSQNAFDDRSRFVAEYRESTAGLGLDLGLDLGQRSQLRFGYDVADVRARLRIGEPTLPEAEGGNRSLSLRWVFDGQTSPVIPTRGVYLRTSLSRYFNTPDLIFGEVEVEGPEDYTQAEASLSVFRSTADDHRLFVGASGGSSFGDDAGYNDFELGGLLRLGAFNIGEVRGDNYALAHAGGLYRTLRLPDVLGGNGYLGGWLEVGSAFDEWDTVPIQWQATGGFVLETIVGPVFVGGSVSLNEGSGRFYVNVGPFLSRDGPLFR